MTEAQTARTALAFLLLTVVVCLLTYEFIAIWRGWSTITAYVRWLNDESGWLVALAWFSLGVHFWFGQVWEFLRK